MVHEHNQLTIRPRLIFEYPRVYSVTVINGRRTFMEHGGGVTAQMVRNMMCSRAVLLVGFLFAGV